MRHLILKIKESGMPYKFSRSCLETVMSMLRGLRKKENSSSMCIGCSFFKFFSVKAVRFFLCKVEQWSIIKWVFGRILKAIIRKSAKQTKVCDAKLQGL